MITRYGDRTKFLTLFNPDLQMKVCKDSQLCFFGDAPVLSELNMAYGEMTATMWLVPQLYDLSEYCGCKEKLQGKPLEECASVIATEFYWLKVSELMLFFHRFKSGRYGRFYGSVDPLVITTSLRAFLNERNNAIAEQEQYEREQEREESRKNAITYEEYCKKYDKPDTPNVNPLEDPMALFSRPKKKPLKDAGLSEESMLKLAKELVNNTFDTDRRTIAHLREVFKKHANVEPEEYIKTHGESM